MSATKSMPDKLYQMKIKSQLPGNLRMEIKRKKMNLYRSQNIWRLPKRGMGLPIYLCFRRV